MGPHLGNLPRTQRFTVGGHSCALPGPRGAEMAHSNHGGLTGSSPLIIPNTGELTLGKIPAGPSLSRPSLPLITPLIIRSYRGFAAPGGQPFRLPTGRTGTRFIVTATAIKTRKASLTPNTRGRALPAHGKRPLIFVGGLEVGDAQPPSYWESDSKAIRSRGFLAGYVDCEPLRSTMQ